MLVLMYYAAMLLIFGKLLIWGIKAAWSLTKLFLTIVFLPMILVGLMIGGLLYIAVPLLILVGFGAFFLAGP